MPPLPEHAHRVGDEGIPEVLGQLEAEHPPQADGHVGIAGKIIVEVHQVSEYREPADRGGKFVGRCVEQAVHRAADGVRDDHLFPQADDEAARALDEIIGGDVPIAHVLRHVRVALDGPLEHLGEEREENAQRHRVLLRPVCIPVYVHDVGYHGEGIERDADGKMQLRDAEGGAAEEPDRGVNVPDYERRVFEKYQGKKVEYDRQGQDLIPVPARAGKPEAEAVVHRHDREQEQGVGLLAPEVEQEARDEKQNVSPDRPVPREDRKAPGRWGKRRTGM